MRAAIALFLALAACSGGDDDGPGPDGGVDPFIGAYTPLWSPPAPWSNVTIVAASGDADYALNAWETVARTGNCDLTDCSLEPVLRTDGGCLTGAIFDWQLCPSGNGLAGTVDIDGDRYSVTLTRQ